MLKQTLFVALAVSLASIAPAAAISIVYTGLFSAEVSGGTGSGNAVVTVDTDLLTMDVQASVSGLSGNVTVAHIHCCTVSAGTGNAGVAVNLPGFPLGATSGSYDSNPTLDLTQSAAYGGTFLTASGGTAAGAFAAVLAGLNDQRAYFNVHTISFPSGEVRALLVPVPEPGTASLVLLGLGLLGHSGRKRTLRA